MGHCFREVRLTVSDPLGNLGFRASIERRQPSGHLEDNVPQTPPIYTFPRRLFVQNLWWQILKGPPIRHNILLHIR